MSGVRVLLAVDFSETSLQAIPVAKRLVAGLGAELVVVHALAPGGARRSYIPGRSSPPTPAQVMHSDSEEAQLNKLKEEHLADLPNVTLQLVSGETAYQAIVDQAKRMRCDFIVLSTHGRRGLPRALMGSVAEGVVRSAHCPVVVVPTGDLKEHA